MNWQHSLEALGALSIVFCILLCWVGARITKRRDRERLQAPRREAIRHVYQEYTVGNMRGVR